MHLQGQATCPPCWHAVAVAYGQYCPAVTLWLIHNYSVKEFNGGGIGLLFKYSGKTLAG